MQPQKIFILPPWRVNGNPKGEGVGGVTKANIFEEKYEVKLEFPEGWGTGVQTQNTFSGGVWVF